MQMIEHVYTRNIPTRSSGMLMFDGFGVHVYYVDNLYIYLKPPRSLQSVSFFLYTDGMKYDCTVQYGW